MAESGQSPDSLCHPWLIQVDPNPGVRGFGLIISLSRVTGMLGCGGGRYGAWDKVNMGCHLRHWTCVCVCKSQSAAPFEAQA